MKHVSYTLLISNVPILKGKFGYEFLHILVIITIISVSYGNVTQKLTQHLLF